MSISEKREKDTAQCSEIGYFTPKKEGWLLKTKRMKETDHENAYVKTKRDVVTWNVM